MSDHIDIATPTRTLAILNKYGLKAKKSLGQNFIIDTNILDNIVKSGHVDDDTVVIEVGPGIGALTEQIAKRAKRVYAFEIDQRLLTVLDDTLSPYDNVEVIHQDILKVNLNEFYEQNIQENEKVVIIANLPYYITTPIIMNFLEAGFNFDHMVFMMQKEVARRISASPNSKEYSSLSIAIQYYVDAEVLFTVPKTVFMPQPNVDSAIIRLSKKDQAPVQVTDEEYFFKLCRSAFVQRRKTIWNNLKLAFGKDPQVTEKVEESLAQVNIDKTRRGESLTIEEFADLANYLYESQVQFASK